MNECLKSTIAQNGSTLIQQQTQHQLQQQQQLIQPTLLTASTA
jgi:hypothetical protein